MNKNYISFIAGLILAVSTASCGSHPVPTIPHIIPHPAGPPGTNDVPPTPQAPLNGDWVITAASCSTGTPTWALATYTLNGPAGLFTFYKSYNPGSPFTSVSFSVTYSGSTVTFSNFATPQCGTYGQDRSTQPCGTGTPTIPPSTKVIFNYDLSKKPVTLNSQGATDVLSCNFGTAATSQLSLW